MKLADMPVGSIARAARVLQALSGMPDGGGLSELVARTHFTKTTTFRVLTALQDVNYVVQDPEDRTYRLGTGLAALSREAGFIDLASLAERPIGRLADLSEDTVFLSVPEGAVSVCIARHVGAFPIRTLTLDRGDRRPLGIGAGALALYCALPDRRREAVCRVNAGWLADYQVTVERLERQRDHFLTNGYALNDGGIVPGMSAIALPIVMQDGHLAGAIAIGAIKDRMTRERIETVLLPALKAETQRVRERLNAMNTEVQRDVRDA